MYLRLGRVCTLDYTMCVFVRVRVWEGAVKRRSNGTNIDAFLIVVFAQVLKHNIGKIENLVKT